MYAGDGGMMHGMPPVTPQQQQQQGGNPYAGGAVPFASPNGGLYSSMGAAGGGSYGEGGLMHLALGDTATPSRCAYISSACYDSFEDLLWTGTADGRVQAFFSPVSRPDESGMGQMFRHCYFKAAANTPVVALSTIGNGLVCVTGESVRFHSRGGVTRSNSKVEGGGVVCGVMPSLQRPDVLLSARGEEQNRLLLHDLAESKIVREIEVEGDPVTCFLPQGNTTGNRLYMGTQGGDVQMRDARTLKLTRTAKAHGGPVASIDMRNNLLVTCGLSSASVGRYGDLLRDPMLKVFDVRTMRQLSPLSFRGGAVSVRFLPKFSSTLAAVGAQGSLTLLEVEGGGFASGYHRVQSSGHGMEVTCMSVASTGESLAFGDSNGMVHYWGDGPYAVQNQYTRPTEEPAFDEEEVQYDITENDSLAVVPVPYCDEGEQLLSEWDDTSSFCLPQYCPPVNTKLIEGLKWNGFVGHAPYPKKYIPNHEGSMRKYTRWGTASTTMLRKKQGDSRRSFVEFLSSPLRREMEVKREYARVEIKIGRLGLYAFDFSSYNKTYLTGLDNLLPNSYCNAVLQMLYFTPGLRVYMLNHLCSNATCLLCELGFLFHMLDKGKRRTAEPRNFLRTLKQIPEATALGLLDPIEPSSELMLAVKIQDFLRFLIAHLNKHKEVDAYTEALNAALDKLQMNSSQKLDQETLRAMGLVRPPSQPQSVVQKIMGCRVLTVDQCCVDQTHRKETEGDSFAIKLHYPEPKGVNGHGDDPPSFSQILQDSLNRSATRRVWCDGCKKYQNTSTSKSLVTLPHVMTVQANVNTDAELELWRRSHSTSANLYKQFMAAAAGSSEPLSAVEHKKQREKEEAEAKDALEDEERADTHWVPFFVRVQLIEDGPPVVERFSRRQWEIEQREQQRTGGLAAQAAGTGATKANIGSKGGKAPLTPAQKKQAKQAAFSKSQDPLAALPTQQDKDVPVERLRTAVYRLTAVVAHVSDPPEKDSALNTVNGEHLVLHQRIGPPAFPRRGQPTRRATFASPKGKGTPRMPALKPGQRPPASTGWDTYGRGHGQDDGWHILNDFMLSPSAAEEAVKFSYPWKQPCVLTYTRVDMEELCPAGRHENPFATAMFHPSPSLSMLPVHLRGPPTFTPLAVHERVGPGTIVAIDCEFVCVQQKDSKVIDGKEVVLRPARLTLARVSVVRGDEPAAGVPFIDDYIIKSEAIVDYLTRYSGVKPGDLDPSVTPHHLVTLKSAYVRLRSLVDRGVVFVGHGLKKDFQMLNILVPPEQIVDTVHLFHLDGRRRLGLRFLSYHLLGMDIQGVTHDSIEDARTALRLYRKYQQLEAVDNVESALRKLYDIGHAEGFKI